jgi:chromosome segregation ATPase
MSEDAQRTSEPDGAAAETAEAAKVGVMKSSITTGIVLPQLDLGIPEEVMVTPGTWAADITAKHNATAQKLFSSQKEMYQIQTKAVEELQKVNNQLDAKQQKIEDDMFKKQQAKEMEESMNKLVEERVTNAKAECFKSVRDLDESVNPKFLGLERTLQDLVSQQKEMQTQTLPRWRADVGGDIQSLRTDLAHYRDMAERGERLHVEKLTLIESGMANATSSLESKMMARIDQLEERLGKADKQIEALASELAGASKRLDQGSVERAEDKAALHKKIEEVESAHVVFKECWLKEREEIVPRLAKFENVVHHVLYEFEEVKSKIDKELAEQNKSITIKSEELDRKGHSIEKQLLESFEKTKDSMERALQSQVDEERRKIDEVAGRLASVQEVEAKQEAEIKRVGEALEQKSKHLEQLCVSEAKEVLLAIRSDEGRRLAEVEGAMKLVQPALDELGHQLRSSTQGVRDELAAFQSASDLRIKEVDNGWQSSLKVIQQAVDELAQMFQEFGMLQQSQDASLKEMAALVHSMEIKIWPWKKERRSPSPGSRPVSGRRVYVKANETTTSTDVPEGGHNLQEAVQTGAVTGHQQIHLRPLSASRTQPGGVWYPQGGRERPIMGAARTGGGYRM